MASNRKCILCSKTYEYCNCDKYKDYPKWYVMFHDANCHEIWYVLSDYESGIISKEEALERMKVLDPSVIKNENALVSYKKLLGIEETKEESNDEPKVDVAPVVESPAKDVPAAEPVDATPDAVESDAESTPAATTDGLKKNVKSQRKVIGKKN